MPKYITTTHSLTLICCNCGNTCAGEINQEGAIVKKYGHGSMHFNIFDIVTDRVNDGSGHQKEDVHSEVVLCGECTAILLKDGFSRLSRSEAKALVNGFQFHS